jgi:outer membrane protein TolC
MVPIILSFHPLRGQAILDQYIQTGFEKNLSIHQQQFALEKSAYALKEAKTLFLPSVGLLTDYFLAGGGRTVDFPAGDLLNPVYNSLNQLTNSTDFPVLENENILLNPNNFYDIKLRTTLPILNLEIAYNRRIKEKQVDLQKLEVDLYKRELAKEIKMAYFAYLQSEEAVTVYRTALELVKESHRMNESLFRNNKVNRTTVLRSENEILKFEAQQDIAVQNANSAKAYFNFLINRQLSEAIIIDEGYQTAHAFLGDSSNFGLREEVLKLAKARVINEEVEGLAKSFAIPRVSTFLDLGSQGFDGAFDRHTRYYFYGISFQWDLFSSGRNRYKTKQVQLDNQIIQSQSDYVETQLKLQLTTVVNSFNASLRRYQAAVSSYQSSQSYYGDIMKLYQEGKVLFLELLDAQNQLVQSELQVTVSLYETHSKAAEIERANASFNINKY